MNDQTRSILAAFLELALPVALVISCVLWPTSTRRSVVVLGAITPLLIGCAATAVRYLLQGQQDAQWAFFAMWTMSFIPYVACAAVGTALGLLSVPKGTFARYILGFASPSAVALLVAVGV